MRDSVGGTGKGDIMDSRSSAAAPRSILIVGGQRSGKSRYAEARSLASGMERVYLATATAGDREMRSRIAAHRDRRGEDWLTVEETLDVAEALRREARPHRFVLVECLTLWLSNLYGAGRDLAEATRRLADSVAGLPGVVAFVSNEVGSGIIPDNAMARAYADALGSLNQAMGAAVDEVVLVVAGQPLTIKAGAR